MLHSKRATFSNGSMHTGYTKQKLATQCISILATILSDAGKISAMCSYRHQILQNNVGRTLTMYMHICRLPIHVCTCVTSCICVIAGGQVSIHAHIISIRALLLAKNRLFILLIKINVY